MNDPENKRNSRSNQKVTKENYPVGIILGTGLGGLSKRNQN